MMKETDVIAGGEKDKKYDHRGNVDKDRGESKVKADALIELATDKLSGATSSLEAFFLQLDVPTDEEIISGLEQIADDFDDAANDLDAKLEEAYKKAIRTAQELSQKVDDEVTKVLKSPEIFKSMWCVYRAKKKLQKICNRPNIDYAEKENVLKEVRKIITEVKDINALVKLYVFINLPEVKDKLNIHKNPIKDTILLNRNTASWQKLLDHIREHAFNRLLKKAGLTQQQWALIESGQESNPPIDNPKQAWKILNTYAKELIFCQHHSNKNLFNLFHPTKTSGKIEKLIHYCQYKADHDQKLKERIHR